MIVFNVGTPKEDIFLTTIYVPWWKHDPYIHIICENAHLFNQYSNSEKTSPLLGFENMTYQVEV